jgi:hypothetical protein
MAARIPRRTFATPLIALAAVPSCFVSSSTPPSQPVSQAAPGQPVQSDPAPNTPPPSQSPVIVANPPRPRPQPDPEPPPAPPVTDPADTKQQPPANKRWTVFKTSSGCEAAIETSCPKGAMCNPPPPMKYACPDNVKLPAKIVTFGDGCAIEPEPTHCPPKAACNPPPPRKVACPTR